MEEELSSRKRWVVAALLAAVFGLGLAGALRKKTSELPVYTKAAERMLQGEAIYVPDEPKPFTYPPFFALPFVWGGLGDKIDRVVWFSINTVTLVCIVLLLGHVLRPVLARSSDARGPPRWIFWALLAVLAGRHVSAVFENQSHDLLVMLAVVASLVAAGKRHELRAGALAGAGAACKATPLLFVPVFVWQRRFAAAVAAIVAAVVLSLLPDLILPQADGTPWIRSWYDTFIGKLDPGGVAEAEGAWSRWNILNQNLTGTIYRLSTPVAGATPTRFDVSLWSPSPELLQWVMWAAQGAVLLFVVFVTRPASTRGVSAHELAFRRLAEGGVIVSAMVLLSPMSSKSHFCVLALPVAVALADVLYRKRDPWLIGLLAVVFGAGTLTVKGIWGRSIGNELLARGSVTVCAIACLLAAGHVLFHRRAHGRDERTQADSASVQAL